MARSCLGPRDILSQNLSTVVLGPSVPPKAEKMTTSEDPQETPVAFNELTMLDICPWSGKKTPFNWD